MLRDWRIALRGIMRHWPFSVSAVLSLTIALATAGVVLGLGDAILFERLLPEGADGDRVVRVFTSRTDGSEFGAMSFADVSDMEQQSNALDRMAWSYKSLVPVGGLTSPSRNLLVENVSYDYFSILGMGLRVGADPRDDVVVLERGFSKLFFGEEVPIDRTIMIDGRTYRVGDLAPADFRGLTPGIVPALWIVRQERDGSEESSRASRFLDVVGELSPGATAESAVLDLRRASEALAVLYPDTNEGRRVSVVPLNQSRFNPEADEQLWRIGTLVILGSGLFVLLVCLNLGGFVVARAEGKRSTIATQIALGGTRIDVMRVPFWEAAMLTGGAVGLAFLVTGWMLPALLSVAFPVVPLGFAGRPTPRVVAGLWALGGFAAALYGVVPYALVGGQQPRTGAGVADRKTRATRISRIALTTQTWVAVVLLATATLLIESVEFRQYLDPGFRTNGLTLAQISMAIGTDGDADAAQRAAARFAGQSVAQSDWLPLSSGTQSVTVRWSAIDSHEGTGAIRASVTPNFFATMSMTFERGGTFRGQDDAVGPLEMVITEELATRLGATPDEIVGALVDLPGLEPSRVGMVVGVLSNHKAREVTETATAVAYFALGQASAGERYLIAPSGRLRPTSELREFIDATEGLTLNHIRTIEDHVGQSMAGPRSLALSFLSMALVGTGLVALGVFGITSHSVQRRRQEIGIRAALGASPARLALSVVLPECRPLASGLLLGVMLTVGVHFLFADFFPGTSLYDMRLFVACVFPPGAAAILALVPALRSGRGSPMLALPRAE